MSSVCGSSRAAFINNPVQTAPAGYNLKEVADIVSAKFFEFYLRLWAKVDLHT